MFDNLSNFWREQTYRFRQAEGQRQPEPRAVRLPEAPDLVAHWLAESAQAAQLADMFQIRDPLRHMTLPRAQMTLTRLSTLLAARQAFPESFESLSCPDTLNILDVGCKNWEDVLALAVFSRSLANAATEIHLDGVELDAYRRYWDKTRRLDHAHAAMAQLSSVTSLKDTLHLRYLAKNVCQLWPEQGFGSYDVIGWFLPFVVRNPLVAWGLPDGFFKPAETLTHVVSLLKPQGVLILTNQGDVEAEIQEDLLKEQPAITYQPLRMPTPFYPYRYPHRGWICRRTPASKPETKPSARI